MDGEGDSRLMGDGVPLPAADPRAVGAEPPRLSDGVAPGDTLEVDDEIERALDEGEPRKAVALCVREHGHALARLCMAMTGSSNEAEDLAQETLLAAYHSVDSWRGEGSLRAWLFGIARKKCLKHLEKHRRREIRLRLVDAGEQPDTEALVLLRQRAARARAALGQVRPTEREALLLRYVAQLSFADVASACGIEEATARKRVSRAIHRLREELDEAERP